MKNKIIYAILGIAILAGFFTTSAKTIDRDTLALIERSHKLDTEEIWLGFDAEKYPVDLYYGNVEYRYQDGKITEQEPSISIVALSIFLEEFGPVIKAIPLSEVRHIIDEGGMTKKEREDIYLSVLIHEAFHCHQVDHGADIGMEPGQGYDFNSQTQKDVERFAGLMDRLDADKTFQTLSEREMTDLVNFYETGSGEAWLVSREERIAYERQLLDEDYEFYLNYSSRAELLEGTAKYVELETIKRLTGEEPTFKKEFIKTDYRFYITGALKSYIIDKNVENWQDIDFSDHDSLERLVLEQI